MDQEFVIGRVDRGDPAVMALEVEVGGRDGAVEILERRPGDRAEGRLAFEPCVR